MDVTFEKMSFEEFRDICKEKTKSQPSDEWLKSGYESLKPPAEKEPGVFELYCPENCHVSAGRDFTIPLCFRMKIKEGYEYRIGYESEVETSSLINKEALSIGLRLKHNTCLERGQVLGRMLIQTGRVSDDDW